MNGAVYFQLTPHGWKVESVFDFLHFVPDREVMSIPFYKIVMVTGKFIKKPRVGQFCARPHKLIFTIVRMTRND